MNQNQVVTNNIVMNNYITIGKGHNLRNDGKKGMDPRLVQIDDLMRYFNFRYKSILPNQLNMSFDYKTMLFPFERAQIIEILHQMDILVQLLVQNFLFSFSEETKFKSYELLMKIYKKKNFIESFLDYLPTYQINLSTFKLEHPSNNSANEDGPNYSNKCQIYINVKPQISIIQSPLLEFTELFLEIKSKIHTKEKIKEALLYLEPFIQRNWIPVFGEPSALQGSARTKFNYIDDCLLLIGLTKFGAKKLELIQQNFMPEKKIPEIKNRYKNLICGRASDNKIKRWKVLQFAPLRDEEQIKLQKAIEWFCSAEKYNLISRYFLIERSPDFIKSELTGSDKLVKKRKKYANLIASSTLNDLSPQPVLEIQVERERPDIFINNVPMYPSHEIRNMEVEKDKKVSNTSQEPFEQITLNFSQGIEERMNVEDDQLNKNSLFKHESDENFETEELNISSHESTSSEEMIMQDAQASIDHNMYGKTFKKIGTEIFEYEEII